jgi:hypothetical protein
MVLLCSTQHLKELCLKNILEEQLGMIKWPFMFQ